MDGNIGNIIIASICSGVFSSIITVTAIKRDVFWIEKALQEHKAAAHSRIAKLETKVRDLELKVFNRND